MKKKVCFLVAEHPFLDARIFKKEAKTLLKNGYEVTMIVPRINGYLFDIDGTPFTNEFMSKAFLHEGVNIITYDRVYLEDKIKYLYYNIQSNNPDRFSDSLTQLGIALEADIYHAHEYFSLYSGFGIKRALRSKGKKVKLIYDSHELVPDPLEHNSTKSRNYMEKMLHLMLKEVDFIITVSDSIKSWYLTLNPSVPVEVIYNSPPLSNDILPNDVYKNQFLAVHEGFISGTRGNWDKLLKITEICSKTMDFKFKVIGGKRITDQKKLTLPDHLSKRIDIIGWMDYSSISNEIKNADVGWIDLNVTHSLNNKYAMPNKFFSYLNNGVPVLVNKCTDMEQFINTHQCGHVIDKLEASAEDYAEAINCLFLNRNKLKEMSINARRIMKENYSWDHMQKRLCSVYQKLKAEE